MSLTQSQIQSVQQLAGAAATLTTVTGADQATRGLLRQIEELVNGPAPKATTQASASASAEAKKETVADRIEYIQCSEANVHIKLYGLLKELSQNPETKLGDMKLVAVALGYRGVMLGMV